jgi:cyclopropane-fatty-acyl-phospholipid synthase
MSTRIIPGLRREPRLARGLAALGRRALYARFAALEQGELDILEDGRRVSFGRRAGDGLRATLEVRSPEFWAEVAFGGTVGAAESYIQGHWQVDDLTALVRLVVRNRALLNELEGGAARAVAPLHRALHWLNRNTRTGSRRNIAAHYDLGNDFFRLMLDETMSYSCAIFPTADTTLADAQRLKFDVVCRTLDLRPGERLMEIGTGWGGLAIHAARHYGCHVTTTTISAEQHAHARAAIRTAGLEHSITLLSEDYRDLTGTYDKLVSIEMIEAVGHRFLDRYFATCSRLLAPHGAMLVQAITLQDQLYAAALRSVDFIQRYVFPGGFLPSISAMLESVRRATDLKLFHLADIGPHYATTLAVWRSNFHARLAEVRALGYPEPFLRLWDYYLCYCEGGFLERQLGDVQMLLTKPGCRRPPLAA